MPRVLGGRGTLLVARLGGREGRLLRRGDVLPIASAPETNRPVPALPLPSSPRFGSFRGPDVHLFAPVALDILFAADFLGRHPAKHRVGTRLAGARLPRLADDAGGSSPMVRGAIQVPPSGQPIVLGPDHPTLGGYPVIAAVVRADQGVLAARRIGATVRFVPVGVTHRP